MLQPFVLEEPTSVREASALLARYGEAARLYAGGTELLLAMKEGLLHYEHLINLKTIPDLASVTLEAGTLRIGATTTHRTLERSPGSAHALSSPGAPGSSRGQRPRPRHGDHWRHSVLCRTARRPRRAAPGV